MGVIWSRFKKKTSTKEKLQSIQEEIESLEKYKEFTEQRRKKLVGSFVALSILLYLIAGVVFYLYYLPPKFSERLLYATPFAGFIFFIYIVKRILTWYYRWKVDRNDRKLSSLKEKKEDILTQVMETETYKIAKDILETYAPEQLRKTMAFKTPMATPIVSGPRMIHPQSDVRRRIVATPQSFGPRAAAPNMRNVSPSSSFSFPRPQVMTQLSPQQVVRTSINSATPQNSSHATSRVIYSTVSPVNTQVYHSRPSDANSSITSGPVGEPPGPPMPRPILPRERGILDRFVEYLVGDGPSNRFALVCRQCESHNGMALKDEFPYIAFRCAYCFYWNPARKQKPAPPRLGTIPQSMPRVAPEDEEESSGEEESGQEESETDSSDSNPSSEDNEVEELTSHDNRTSFPNKVAEEKGSRLDKEDHFEQSIQTSEDALSHMEDIHQPPLEDPSHLVSQSESSSSVSHSPATDSSPSPVIPADSSPSVPRDSSSSLSSESRHEASSFESKEQPCNDSNLENRT